MMESAYDSVRDSYPNIEDLREIVEHGCSSGVAHQHIYYHQTLSFFDNYEDEVTEYVSDNLGEEFLIHLFSSNTGDLTSYKNDLVWTYVELIAQQLIEEYESTTCEELCSV